MLPFFGESGCRLVATPPAAEVGVVAVTVAVAEGVAVAGGAAVRRDRRGVRGSRTGAGVGDSLRTTIASAMPSSSPSASRWKMAVVLRRLDVPDLAGEGTVVWSAFYSYSTREEGEAYRQR